MKLRAEHSLDALLLVLVSLHYAYEPLVALVGWTTRAWFYVFQGFTGAVLFLLVALVVRRGIPLGIALWGAVEQGLVTGCRLVQFPGPPPPVGEGEGICAAHGLNTYMIGLFVVAAFAFILARRQRG